MFLAPYQLSLIAIHGLPFSVSIGQKSRHDISFLHMNKPPQRLMNQCIGDRTMTTPKLISKFISINALLLTAGIITPAISLHPSLVQRAVAQSAQSTATQIYQQASPAVVTIKNGSGHGSGFIVSADGWIITNAHVVANGPRIVTVKFNDGRQVSADVIGFAHHGVDLAALKIYGPTNLPSLSLSPAGSTQVGDDIFVIGTPLDEDYQNTLSRGMVGRLNHQNGTLQHSANTNPGNSGGPVLNRRGQVVGVHFSGDVRGLVYSPTGRPIGVTKSGINFAISGDRLQTFLKAMRAGKISRVSTLPKPSQKRTIPQLASRNFSARLEKTDIQLTPQTFIDLYQFQGKAGQSVTLTLKSDEFNPVLQLFFVDQSSPKPKYIPVAKNDDRGPADFTAQLNLSLPQDGLYYIGVTTSDRGEQGRYQIQAKGI